MNCKYIEITLRDGTGFVYTFEKYNDLCVTVEDVFTRVSCWDFVKFFHNDTIASVKYEEIAQSQKPIMVI